LNIALDGIVTLEEEWTSINPSLSHLRIFGCDAYVHIPRDKRKKLNFKSQKCILVGIMILLKLINYITFFQKI
jgi:hypothetical protein